MTNSFNQTENLANAENLPLPNYYLNPYKETKNTFENNSGKKLTIPDQSLTVKEILHRFTRGQRIPDALVGYYDAENDPLGLDGTNIETLDLSQKYELFEAVKKQTHTLRSRYQKEQHEKQLNKLKQEISKEINDKKLDSQHLEP